LPRPCVTVGQRQRTTRPHALALTPVHTFNRSLSFPPFLFPTQLRQHRRGSSGRGSGASTQPVSGASTPVGSGAASPVGGGGGSSSNSTRRDADCIVEVSAPIGCMLSLCCVGLLVAIFFAVGYKAGKICIVVSSAMTICGVIHMIFDLRTKWYYFRYIQSWIILDIHVN
jgi:hypothetical protein